MQRRALRKLVDLATSGVPQIILRRGEPAAAIIAYAQYERIQGPQESLLSFLRRSPLVGIELDLRRSPEHSTSDLDLK
jgi:prevent-host-death family protein